MCSACVCIYALYTCSASLFSVRRMHSWPVQAIGNGEDYAIPPAGNGEPIPEGSGDPVYDYVVVNLAAQCGENRDEEAGRSEPCYATPHSARAPQPMKQKETLL